MGACFHISGVTCENCMPSKQARWSVPYTVREDPTFVLPWNEEYVGKHRKDEEDVDR